MEEKKLREYQQRIVDAVLESDKSQIICLPTGSGKTFIAAEVMNRLAEKEMTSVFIVPRLELIAQATEEFGDVDTIWSDKTCLTGKQKIVASKDSLRTQLGVLDGYDKSKLVLIFDEAHIGIEQTHNLVTAIGPARVLGLSATPERMDGLALLKGNEERHKFGVFDELLQKETVSSLIKKGYLTKLRYFTRPIEGITELKADTVTGEELSDAQINRLFDSNQIWGDLVASYEKYGKGRPAVGFTNTVAMAEKVASIFQDAGYKFYAISGSMSVEERAKLIQDLTDKKIDGLVNAALLTYGFDCPPVSYAFSVRHIKSRPLWFQIVGRILRTSALTGKEDAIFVDHGDSISEFMQPYCSLPILDPVLEWQADGQTQEEKDRRKEEVARLHKDMGVIQSLSVTEGELTEVTTDTTWERVLKLLYDFKGRNKFLHEENERMSIVIQKLNQDVQTLNRRIDELSVRLRHAKNDRQAEPQPTYNNSYGGGRYQNRNGGGFNKSSEYDATYNFCRTHYWKARNAAHNMLLSNRDFVNSDVARQRELEHEESMKLLRSQAATDGLDIHEKAFASSMRWWEINWNPNFKKDGIRRVDQRPKTDAYAAS